MEKNYVIGLAILVALMLVSAGMFGYAVKQTSNTETIKETIKEVPVEKIVTITETIEVDKSAAIKDSAVEEFLKKYKKNDTYVCGGDEYDWSQITVSNTEDFSINSEDDITSVEFEIKLKYKQDEVKQCYVSYEPKVTFEEGEKAIVSY